MQLPYVVIHNIMSLDGRIDHFTPDIGQYYDSAAALDADCMLTGSDTILKAMESEGIAPDKDEPEDKTAVTDDDSRPLLVIVDSKGRVNTWRTLRNAGYWRDTMALCSLATPAAYREYLNRNKIDFVVAGDDYVDLRQGLEKLAKSGIKKVRVDSGGTLNGVLLRQGLVDEVSVLMHPALVGGTSAASIYRAPDLESAKGIVDLRIISARRLKNGVVWLRYSVKK